jgi:nicotinate-nucleotide pyrophosphorylase (carboxylating)
MNYNSPIARKLPSAITLKCDFQWLGKCFILSYTIRELVKQALKEDIGKRDITTELVIPREKFSRAIILAKEGCVVCGLKVAESVFKTKDKKLQFRALVKDGRFVKRGKILAQVQGKTWSILTAERVALNFLSLLSGIATKTRLYVKAVKPYKVKIMDTRKTIPGLRELEKYAVRIGGGYNHRLKLDEMILIKDNHIQVIGHRSWVIGLKEIRKKILPQTKIEVEVKNLKEFKQVLEINPDIIMFDNMSVKDIKKAVKIRNNLRPKTKDLIPKLEASGGITLENIKKIAASGVDMISIGELTDSVKSADISLEVL